MTIKLIIAVDQGNAIGWCDGRLPWKIPTDMARFKALTSGHTVVMGFNTYESLKRPDGLPNRRNIVMTKKSLQEMMGKFGDKIEVISSFDWVRAHQECLGCDPGDLWIIGGANVYAQAIEQQLVDEIYLTLVHTDSGADVRLPFDLAAWKLFILRQAQNGVQWSLTAIESPEVAEGPKITFITLRKIK